MAVLLQDVGGARTDFIPHQPRRFMAHVDLPSFTRDMGDEEAYSRCRNRSTKRGTPPGGFCFFFFFLEGRLFVLQGFDRADAPLMRNVNVANFDARALAVQTTGPAEQATSRASAATAGWSVNTCDSSPRPKKK